MPSTSPSAIRCSMPNEPSYEVSWNILKSADNPRKWSFPYKAFVIVGISWNTLIVVLNATNYTSGVSQIADEFQAPETVVTLGLTTYLLGWVAGSLVLAPLSEIYGRRWIYVTSTAVFILLTLPCALGSSLAEVIVVRFFAAFAGAAVIGLSPGTLTDVANDDQRALAYSVWSIGPFNGPVLGPVVGGFTVQYLGWRWNNWITMVGAGLGLLWLLFIPETYAPVIIRRKTRAKQASTGDLRWWSRFDNANSLARVLRISLSRPFMLALTEPICIFWNTYIGISYGILYLSFVAYPIVFHDDRKWAISITGLSFLGIGTGSTLAIVSEPLVRRVVRAHNPDPETGRPPPESMVSVLCPAAILLPLGQFWFAWTSSPSVHWIWPILAGIPFGTGATLGFIYALNYMAYSYGIYAASALAGNTVVRCVLGSVLPLAGPAMFGALGTSWAGSLLGFLLVLMAPVPFVFYFFGARIRVKSSVIKEARAEEARLKNEAIRG